MHPDYPALQKSSLFRGFSAAELDLLLPALQPVHRGFEQGGLLLGAGEESAAVGVVLAGRIEAAKTSRDGGRFIVSRIGPGGVYGDVLALGPVKSPVEVTAATDCRVLLLPARLLLAPAGAGADLRQRLTANLVGTVSEKYFALNARLDLLLVQGLRRRLAAFLLEQAQRAGASRFTIPYDRAALAAWLGCERSALSREISALARAGLIETQRSAFAILDEDGLRALLE